MSMAVAHQQHQMGMPPTPVAAGTAGSRQAALRRGRRSSSGCAGRAAAGWQWKAGAGLSKPQLSSAAAIRAEAAIRAAAAAAEGDGSTQPVPAAAPPSRLHQEVGLLVALDVEYTHLALLPGGRHVGLAAEVCAVDAQGRTLLYEFCNPLEGGPLRAQQQRWRHVGGLPPALWQFAAPLGEVRQRLAGLLQGRILVGHHLKKDLAALALEHPQEATRDTLSYRELQGRGGSGRKLRVLSVEKLGRAIQSSQRRHSPREDAQAAMDLYLRHIHFQPQYMRYDDLVERHLAELLGGSSSAGGSTDSGSDDRDGGGGGKGDGEEAGA